VLNEWIPYISAVCAADRFEARLQLIFLTLCQGNFRKTPPSPAQQASVSKPTVCSMSAQFFQHQQHRKRNSIYIFPSTKRHIYIYIYIYACVLVSGHMAAVCVENVYILCECVCASVEHFKCVYVYARPFGRGQRVWAFAMLSQQGARASSVGTDGFSFPVVYNSDRQRERERERERDEQRNRALQSEIEMEKKKKGTLLLQS